MYGNLTGFASTRIRLFYPNQTINRYHSDKFESRIGFENNSDILIIQKRIDNETLRYVKQFGGFKIFDFDDPVHNTRGFSEMINNIDLVTTDTLGRQEYFNNLKTGKECIIIEDCLDYEIISIFDTPNVSNSASWFGNYPNVNSIYWMIPEIIKNNFDLSVITDARNVIVPDTVKKIQWYLSSFISEMRKTNICILSHSGVGYDVKSNNKMIVSIACGVPCIVNLSKSYEELARQFNLDYSIATDPELLKNAMNFLNDIENRRLYLKNIQPFIINNLNTKTITNKLIKYIEQYA